MIKRRPQTDVKLPSYIPVYNTLYSEIITGVYPADSRLPGENELAKRYGVSRNTLRQAFTILAEDGLITKWQGKGTFVNSVIDEQKMPGKLYNPMIVCSKSVIDDIEISYNIAPPTEVAAKKLQLNTGERVLACNNVYRTAGRSVGHSFMQVPIHSIEQALDLTNREEISHFVNETIFERSSSFRMRIKLVFAEDNITSFLPVPNGTPILFIEEVFTDLSGNPLARCKFYFLPEEYDIVFVNPNDSIS